MIYLYCTSELVRCSHSNDGKISREKPQRSLQLALANMAGRTAMNSILLVSSLKRLSETSIGVSKTSAKVTSPRPPPRHQSIFHRIQHSGGGTSPTFVIFEMARAPFNPRPASFSLSSSVTGKSFGDKERNVVHKG